jgi:hypothetical protein
MVDEELKQVWAFISDRLKSQPCVEILEQFMGVVRDAVPDILITILVTVDQANTVMYYVVEFVFVLFNAHLSAV